MNIKNILITLLFLFISINIFAQNKTVVFFAESVDDISSKVIQKIESSDKFCLAAAFDENKYIKKEIQNLIFFHKIEPMLNIIEPYFPLISSQINISSSVVFDKTEACRDILNNYKKIYRTKFEQYKHGLYLKGSALNDDVLKLFYEYNILWTIAKSEDENNKGLFIKNGVALFVPYKNFTLNETKIIQWFNSVDNVNIIPVILTSEHIKNEKFMLALVNFFNKNKDIDTQLPTDASFYGYNYNTINDNISLKELSDIPIENILKLYFADGEISNYCNDDENENKDEEILSIVYDELSNMYSYNVINGILNHNNNSIKLFDISYTNIFKILNRKQPNINEFQKNFSIKSNLQTDDIFCKFIKKENCITIANESELFSTFSIFKTNDNISFKVNADLTSIDSVDIYIDMNNIAYTGSQKMLNPVNAFFVPEYSWEFAIRITQNNIYVYKYLADKTELVETIPNENFNVNISSNILKGNPYNWNYQVVAVKDGNVLDFIEKKNKKEKMFNSLPLQIKMYNYID